MEIRRLQVCIYANQEDALDRGDEDTTFQTYVPPWTVPCPGEYSVHELVKLVTRRFQRHNPDHRKLDIEYLEDGYGGRLDFQDAVRDIWDPRGPGSSPKDWTLHIFLRQTPAELIRAGTVVSTAESDAQPEREVHARQSDPQSSLRAPLRDKDGFVIPTNAAKRRKTDHGHARERSRSRHPGRRDDEQSLIEFPGWPAPQTVSVRRERPTFAHASQPAPRVDRLSGGRSYLDSRGPPLRHEGSRFSRPQDRHASRSRGPSRFDREETRDTETTRNRDDSVLFDDYADSDIQTIEGFGDQSRVGTRNHSPAPTTDGTPKTGRGKGKRGPDKRPRKSRKETTAQPKSAQATESAQSETAEAASAAPKKRGRPKKSAAETEPGGDQGQGDEGSNNEGDDNAGSGQVQESGSTRGQGQSQADATSTQNTAQQDHPEPQHDATPEFAQQEAAQPAATSLQNTANNATTADSRSQETSQPVRSRAATAKAKAAAKASSSQAPTTSQTAPEPEANGTSQPTEHESESESEAAAAADQPQPIVASEAPRPACIVPSPQEQTVESIEPAQPLLPPPTLSLPPPNTTTGETPGPAIVSVSPHNQPIRNAAVPNQISPPINPIGPYNSPYPEASVADQFARARQQFEVQNATVDAIREKSQNNDRPGAMGPPRRPSKNLLPPPSFLESPGQKSPTGLNLGAGSIRPRETQSITPQPPQQDASRRLSNGQVQEHQRQSASTSRSPNAITSGTQTPVDHIHPPAFERNATSYFSVPGQTAQQVAQPIKQIRPAGRQGPSTQVPPPSLSNNLVDTIGGNVLTSRTAAQLLDSAQTQRQQAASATTEASAAPKPPRKKPEPKAKPKATKQHAAPPTTAPQHDSDNSESDPPLPPIRPEERVAPKRKAPAKKTANVGQHAEADTDNTEATADADAASKPARKKPGPKPGSKRAKKPTADQPVEGEERPSAEVQDGESNQPNGEAQGLKTTRKSAAKKSPSTAQDAENGEEAANTAKPKRKPAAKKTAENAQDGEDTTAAAKPTRKPAAKKAAANAQDGEDVAAGAKPKTAAQKAAENAENGEAATTTAKPGRKPAAKKTAASAFADQADKSGDGQVSTANGSIGQEANALSNDTNNASNSPEVQGNQGIAGAQTVLASSQTHPTGQTQRRSSNTSTAASDSSNRVPETPPRSKNGPGAASKPAQQTDKTQNNPAPRESSSSTESTVVPPRSTTVQTSQADAQPSAQRNGSRDESQDSPGSGATADAEGDSDVNDTETFTRQSERPTSASTASNTVNGENNRQSPPKAQSLPTRSQAPANGTVSKPGAQPADNTPASRVASHGDSSSSDGESDSRSSASSASSNNEAPAGPSKAAQVQKSLGMRPCPPNPSESRNPGDQNPKALSQPSLPSQTTAMQSPIRTQASSGMSRMNTMIRTSALSRTPSLTNLMAKQRSMAKVAEKPSLRDRPSSQLASATLAGTDETSSESESESGTGSSGSGSQDESSQQHQKAKRARKEKRNQTALKRILDMAAPRR